MKINIHWKFISAALIFASVAAFNLIPSINAEAKIHNLNDISGITGEPAVVPPGNLDAKAISSTQIELTWEDLSDSEIRYIIERKTGKSSYFPINTLGINVTSYTDTGLNPGTTYLYRVVAAGLGYNLAYSDEVSVTTPLTPDQPPLIFWPGNGYIVTSVTPLLQWSESENAVAYHLQISTDDHFDNLIINITDLDAPYYDVPESTFRFYASYYWRVRAIDEDDSATGWSETWFFRVLPDSLLVPYFCGCGG